MIKINCPYCNSRINAKAKRCKYCYRYLIPKNIDIKQIEEKSVFLNLELEKGRPEIIQLIKLAEFINEVLFYRDSNLVEIYLFDLINHFLNSLKSFNVYGKSIELTSKFINTCYKISELEIFNSFHEKIVEEIKRLEKQKELMICSLNGINKFYDESLYFPIIYQTENEKFLSSNLETLKVDIIIKQNLVNDNIYIIPSYKKLEDKLFLQIQNSLRFSLGLLKNEIKSNLNKHKLIVKFENNNSHYEGYSFGIVSTIKIIEELINTYQLPLKLKKTPNLSFTGGVDSEGNIIKVDEENIEKKVESVFYSTNENFIVPLENFKTAVDKYYILKKMYPLRKLNILGINNFNEIFGHNKFFSLDKLQ